MKFSISVYFFSAIRRDHENHFEFTISKHIHLLSDLVIIVDKIFKPFKDPFFFVLLSFDVFIRDLSDEIPH